MSMKPWAVSTMPSLVSRVPHPAAEIVLLAANRRLGRCGGLRAREFVKTILRAVDARSGRAATRAGISRTARRLISKALAFGTEPIDRAGRTVPGSRIARA